MQSTTVAYTRSDFLSFVYHCALNQTCLAVAQCGHQNISSGGSGSGSSSGIGNSSQWLKWFCEAGGSPDEARLEQTPYPFQPH